MANNPIIPELLTKQLIRKHYLPIGARTLNTWISAGKFPPADIRMGGKVRLWKRETVETLVDQWAKEGGDHE